MKKNDGDLAKAHHTKVFSTSKKVLIIHSNIQDAIGTQCSSA